MGIISKERSVTTNGYVHQFGDVEKVLDTIPVGGPEEAIAGKELCSMVAPSSMPGCLLHVLKCLSLPFLWLSFWITLSWLQLLKTKCPYKFSNFSMVP